MVSASVHRRAAGAQPRTVATEAKSPRRRSGGRRLPRRPPEGAVSRLRQRPRTMAVPAEAPRRLGEPRTAGPVRERSGTRFGRCLRPGSVRMVPYGSAPPGAVDLGGRHARGRTTSRSGRGCSAAPAHRGARQRWAVHGPLVHGHVGGCAGRRGRAFPPWDARSLVQQASSRARHTACATDPWWTGP